MVKEWSGPVVALGLKHLLNNTNLLDDLDETEKGLVERAIELLECLPHEFEEKEANEEEGLPRNSRTRLPS